MHAKFNKFVSTGIFILFVLSLFTQAVQAKSLYSYKYSIEYQTGGVEIQKEGSTYIQRIDLSTGASLGVIANVSGNSSLPGNFGGVSKKFRFNSIRSFWNQGSSKKVCVTNASFYNGDRSISNPLKVDGEILSEGHQVVDPKARVNNREAMLLLQIWSNRLDIVEANPGSFYGSDAPTIVGGLSPSRANKAPNKGVPRTMVGIADQNQDGVFETALIISSTGKQSKVEKELYDLGASKVIMFDGGGSSKLLCRGGIYKPGEEDRVIPNVLVSIASGEIIEEPQVPQTAPEEPTEVPQEPKPPEIQPTEPVVQPTVVFQPTEPQTPIEWGFLSPFNNSNPLGVYSTRELDHDYGYGERIVGYLHWIDDGEHIPGVDLSNGKGAWVYNPCPQGGWAFSRIDPYTVGKNSKRFLRIDCGGIAEGWQIIFFHISNEDYQTGWLEAAIPVAKQSTHVHYSVGYEGRKKDLPCTQYRSSGRWWIDPTECMFAPNGTIAPIPEITEVVEPSQEDQPTEVVPQQTENPQPQAVETQNAEMEGEVLAPDFNDVKEPSSPPVTNGFVFPTPDGSAIKVENLPPDSPPSVMGISESVWRASDLNKIMMILHALWGLFGIYFTLRGLQNAIAFRLGMLIFVGFFLVIPVLYIPEWNTQGVAYAMAYEPKQVDTLEFSNNSDASLVQPKQNVVPGNNLEQSDQGEIPVPVPPDFGQTVDQPVQPTQSPVETQVSQEVEIPENPTQVPTEEVSSKEKKKIKMPQIQYVELPGDFEPPSPEGCSEFAEFGINVSRWCPWAIRYSQEASQYWMLLGFNVNLPPRLTVSVMYIESRGEVKAYSSQGAVGLMQIMASDGISGINWPELFSARPPTIHLQNPRFNIQWGTMYLAYKYAKYGSWRKALKSYGPTNVDYLYADCILEINNTDLSALNGKTCKALFNR